jgi:hypothetical protein
MKTLAIAAALALAACASTEKAATNGNAPAAKAASGTYYCWKEKLAAHGDALACNWETNAGDACHSLASTTLSRKSVASGPSDVRRCDNGQWLVKVTMK